MIDRNRVAELKAAAPPSTRPQCEPQAPQRDDAETDLINRILAIPFNEVFDLAQFRTDVARLTELSKLRRHKANPDLAKFIAHANLVLGPKPRKETESERQERALQLRQCQDKQDAMLAAGGKFLIPKE